MFISRVWDPIERCAVSEPLNLKQGIQDSIEEQLQDLSVLNVVGMVQSGCAWAAFDTSMYGVLENGTLMLNVSLDVSGSVAC